MAVTERRAPDLTQAGVEERRRYVEAFNTTMVAIWRKQLSKLRVIDTGALFRSVANVVMSADGKVTEVHMSWAFEEYGVYQERGTGREIYKGNPGDIGRDKVRERREWLSPRFYSSYCNIRDFFAEQLGRSFCAAVPGLMGAPFP